MRDTAEDCRSSLDGYLVAAELHRNPATASARLIALSGYGLEEDMRRSVEAGFNLHLQREQATSGMEIPETVCDRERVANIFNPAPGSQDLETRRAVTTLSLARWLWSNSLTRTGDAAGLVESPADQGNPT